MAAPFFSIIIPTYNRDKFLGKAIQSVLTQTDTDFELIIVDDGSTDQTQALVNQYQDQRISCHVQANQGVAQARNQGIELAKGEFIAFLDSDDWWLPTKLERSRTAIAQHPDIKIFHTKERWFRSGQLLNQKPIHTNPDGWAYLDVVKICCISCSTVVIHRSVFNDVGMFKPEFPACEDYDFFLRATVKYPVKLIDECLTEKEGGRDDQLSAQWGLDIYRIKALCAMLDSNTLNQEYTAATFQELVNKAEIYIKGARKRDKLEEVEYYTKLIQQYTSQYPQP